MVEDEVAALSDDVVHYALHVPRVGAPCHVPESRCGGVHRGQHVPAGAHCEGHDNRQSQYNPVRVLSPPDACCARLVTRRYVAEPPTGCQHDSDDVEPEPDEEPGERAHRVVTAEDVRELVSNLLQVPECVECPVDCHQSADDPPPLGVTECYEQNHRRREQRPDRAEVLVLEEGLEISDLPEPDEWDGLNHEYCPESRHHRSAQMVREVCEPWSAARGIHSRGSHNQSQCHTCNNRNRPEGKEHRSGRSPLGIHQIRCAPSPCRGIHHRIGGVRYG